MDIQPTFNKDCDERSSRLAYDRVILSSLGITVNGYKHVQRGDVVALRSPMSQRKEIIKRVVALEGTDISALGSGYRKV